MNRLAVVLAADSATTVTHYTERGAERRYFKGANKVFQLSNEHPVGLMIFDSASIMNVPWEVAIKLFRSHLGPKSFPSLEGYASEFFGFLQGNQLLFPNDVQSEQVVRAGTMAGIRIVFPRIKSETPQEDWDIRVAEKREEIAARTLAACFDGDFVAGLLAAFRQKVADAVEGFFPEGEPRPDDMLAFADLCLLSVLSEPGEFMGTTGLVFAGFGDHDVFPAMVEYTSHGIVSGRHVAFETSRMRIEHEVPAWLSAFAQTSMSDTFSRGLSSDVFVTVMTAVGDGLSKLADDLCAAQNIDRDKIPNVDDILAAARSSISDEVLNRTMDDHALPLRRVLGSLPVEEMAELAETLIHLQSLKEKVTVPTETVGGPVDVAVITRSEGLVWIKRKHYFNPSLNSRYMQRLASEVR